jgi:hypothetical protein
MAQVGGAAQPPKPKPPKPKPPGQGPKTKSLSVSQADIEDHIITYFVVAFGASAASLSAATDLKLRFNFSDAGWAAFAEILDAQGWMKLIKVRLAQAEMATATTLGQLVSLIWKKV